MENKKNWWVAFLLCWFLGNFGAHDFYAGKTKYGIIKLLTCGACGVWTLIDWVKLILQKYTDAEGNVIAR